MPALLILTSCPQEVATDIARQLVQTKLAACVNIIPALQSIYRWHDAVEETKEALLMIKTTEENYSALEAEISKLHPYETPEIIAMALTKASTAYLAWLNHSCDLTSV